MKLPLSIPNYWFFNAYNIRNKSDFILFFNNLGKIPIYMDIGLDSNFIVFVGARKGLFLLKIITFKY